MFNQLNLLPQIWRSARLTLRLLRDDRVPILAKVVFYATVAYMISPLDFVPDWIPVLGQADDLVAILAGLNLFFWVCPSWIVEEHEADIDGRLEEPSDERRATGPGRDARQTVDGQYRRMA